jgi:hypothetical protein
VAPSSAPTTAGRGEPCRDEAHDAHGPRATDDDRRPVAPARRGGHARCGRASLVESRGHEIAPRLVGGLEGGGMLGRLGRVLRQQQACGLERLPHSTGRVEPRGDGECDGLEVRLGRGHARALEQGRHAGSRVAADPLEAEARDRPVLPDDRRDVGHGADGREVGQGQGEGRPAVHVGQHELGDLEGDAAAGQATIRVRRVGSVRVHQRERRWRVGRHAVVVGDDDVDATLGGGGDLVPAAAPAVDGDDERDAGRHRGLDRREREAVSLVQAARDVRLHRQAEPAEGEHQDREAVEPIGVEVAEDHHPLATRAGRRQARDQPVGVRQEPRVVEPVERLREPGVQVAYVADAAADEHRGHPLGDAAAPGGLGQLRGRVNGLREAPAEARFQHGLRMPRGAAPRRIRSAAPIRTPRDAHAARASRRPGRAADRPRRTSRPAAAPRRRSTSRSRTRCR